MSVVAIIPARYGSTRLPGKPLAMIGDKPMIQHVYENAARTRTLDRVIVATDDARVATTVHAFGGEVVMTSKRHRSGSDRLAEVARKLRADWLVNVQGDLPFIDPEIITRALRPLRRDRSIPMGTVCSPIYEEKEWRNPNTVKVIKDAKGFAIYFSRAPIPYPRNTSGAGTKIWGWRHLGLYVYRREFLLKFAGLRPTVLERIESLEQLRALYHGYRIIVADVDERSVEVDTPADLDRAQRYYKRLKGHYGDKN
ncbi:MAG TPA: 3-deoxy-manno-octulosonate cytidylyltransferase [Candidatus Binatia bacterium]|nr:3-deoxy-manno-octulosonate cytidylyltransferase [Candidatus Binatia bacterium]